MKALGSGKLAKIGRLKDVYVSGIARIELLGESCMRLIWYADRNGEDALPYREAEVELVIQISASPQIRKQLEAAERQAGLRRVKAPSTAVN